MCVCVGGGGGGELRSFAWFWGGDRRGISRRQQSINGGWGRGLWRIDYQLTVSGKES